MNVVSHGILPLLAMAALLLVAVLPSAVASLMQRARALAVALGQSRTPRPLPAGLVLVLAGGRQIPTDVVPAHQAWRAPPTVRPQSAADDPTDGVGRRLG